MPRATTQGMVLKRIIGQNMEKETKERLKIGQTKTKTKQEYMEARRDGMNSLLADKQRCTEDLVELAERAVPTGHMKGVYGATKKISSKCSKPGVQVKDKTGRHVFGHEAQLERWIEQTIEVTIPRRTPHLYAALAKIGLLISSIVTSLLK